MKSCTLLMWLALVFVPMLALGQFDADANRYDTIGIGGRRQIAADALQAIKEGVLIVRLASNSRKLEELDKLLANKDLNENRRQRLQEMKDQTVAETSEENRLVVEAFNTFYDFSDLLFMYDADVQRLKQGEQSGYFLDKNLQVDPNISLNGRSYIIAFYGNNLSSALKERKSVFVVDTNNIDLPPPFPDSSDKFAFEFIARWFDVTDTRQGYHVRKFNRRLHGLYAEYQEKGLIK